MGPLETPTLSYPCNPIQGYREARVFPSMYWTGVVLLTTQLVQTEQHTCFLSLTVSEEFETGNVQYLNLLHSSI